MPYAVGTFASRGAVMSGNAVALAARVVRTKALKIAADALEVSPDDLEIDDGVISVKGAPGTSIALSTVAVLSNPLRYAFDQSAAAATQFAGTFDPDKPPVADDEEPGLEGKDFYSPTQATFANGMHAAIVETDPVTAEIRILRYCVVHDCGVMVNPMIVEGQVHGGVAQGVGGALYERMVYDESGQLLNASFMDFLVPVRVRGPPHRDRPPRDPQPAQPPRPQGRRRGRHHPGVRGHRLRHRGCRGVPHPLHADQPGRALGAAPAARNDHRPRSRAGRFAMKISGSSTLESPVDKVWEAIQDPAVLARCLPGCESLAVIGEDRYAMSVTAGVAAIKGTYAGEVSLSDKVAPNSLTMRASGAGAPGTIDADVKVQLVPSAGGGTDLSYDADASVGGAIGGVGQRMLAGVTKKMAGQFFTALDRDIAGLPPLGAELAGAAVGAEGAAPASGAVYPGRAATANANATLNMDNAAGFALGVLVGGLLALAGVALGARIGRQGR